MVVIDVEVEHLLSEVESRTKSSRPSQWTQKKSEAKAKDRLFKEKLSAGQGQKCSRPRTKDSNF